MEETFKKLIQHVSVIEAPTQVIWGRDDELVHVSGASVLKDKLPNCRRVDILDRCGHLPQLDRPAALVKILLEFRGELSKRKKYFFI